MPTDQPKNLPKKPLNSWIKYSSMGIQMGATILILTYAGIKLDAYFGLKFPVFTLVLALFSVTAVLWYFIKSSNPKK